MATKSVWERVATQLARDLGLKAARVPAQFARMARDAHGRNWKQLFDTQSAKLPRHIAIRHRLEVDGISMLRRCNRCGGREEVGYAHGELEAAFGGDENRPEPTARFTPFPAWCAQHTSCEPDQGVGMPEPVRSIIDRDIESARRRLAQGKAVLPHLLVIYPAGDGYVVPLDGLTPTRWEGDLQRDAEVALLHKLIRSAKERRTPLAIASVAECWAIEQSGPGFEGRYPSLEKQLEIITVAVITRSSGWIAGDRIERQSGKPEQGPGSFGDLRWQPLIADSLLLDGVLQAPTGTS